MVYNVILMETIRISVMVSIRLLLFFFFFCRVVQEVYVFLSSVKNKNKKFEKNIPGLFSI